jgi:hypothetical protein
MKKINLFIIISGIVVVTSLIMHVESEIQNNNNNYFGDINTNRIIFWSTAVTGSIAAVIIWFGTTKIIKDRKNVQYKLR